jgi:hypothetical protein
VELLAQLREELARPRSPRTITVNEYRYLQELAAFRCPIGIGPRICDGRVCPTRPQLLCDLGLCSLGSRCRGSYTGCFTDYFDECSDARHARLKLKESHLTLTPTGEPEKHQPIQAQQIPDDADRHLVARKYGGTVVWR